MLVGADTGGTFTDLVGADGAVVKVLSRPDHPARPVAEGCAVLGAERPATLAHGTTVATNALLEGRLGSVALITNRGLADVIEIARQDRPSLYDPFADRPPPLVPRHLRFEIDARLDARGRTLRPPDVAELPELPPDVDTVAVCFVHSDLEPAHERLVGDVLRAAGHDVVLSADVSPEFREYERTVTTVASAGLRPRCRGYLHGLADVADEVHVMTSAGGLVDVAEAADHPVRLLVSGPAAGARAAAALAAAVGLADAVSFDMGGTSTDVCLLGGGEPAAAPDLEVAGYPVRIPSLDVHTIGAGGGSIAWLDPGGALRVGPTSAGADPGPAAYGRGGTQPTVTDADLVLGRIDPDATFPGLGRLDLEAARSAIRNAGVDAEGIVDVVDAAMVQAVRWVSVERGVDPRGLALVAFGGAGPLHACAVADALDMPAVVVPPRAGAFSAVGLLTAPRQRDHVRSYAGLADLSGLDVAVDALVAQALAPDPGPPAPDVAVSYDCRYRGQSHELTVPHPDAFAEHHAQRNGFTPTAGVIEVTAVRARITRPALMDMARLPAVERTASAAGPATLAEPDCTVWVPPGWTVRAHSTGAWILERDR